MIRLLAPFAREILAVRGDAMVVRVAAAKGSTPRGTDAAMLATMAASHGTIGGGQLEFHAIDVARDMMAAGTEKHELAIPLGAHLGQCCGGHVTLDFSALDDAEATRLERVASARAAAFPAVTILGAGHTGRALALALAPLPFATTLADDRAELLAGLPRNIATRLLDDAEAVVAACPPGSAVVILTHSHALDYRLAQAALRRGDLAYVGMIGSATKRARFERWFLASGGTKEALARLTCPIGGPGVADKRPEVIAALTASELLRCMALRPAPVAALEVAEPAHA